MLITNKYKRGENKKESQRINKRNLVKGVRALNMPNTIQPRENSKGSGIEDTFYASQLQRQSVRPVSVLQRWCLELEQQLAGQRLQRHQSVGSARNFLKFSPYLLGEFCF